MTDVVSPPPDIAPIRHPKIGTVNILEAFVGNRGMGKSTYECYRALEISRSLGGAYVIGHSSGARLPVRLPKELGGEELPISYYPTLEKLDRGLRNRPDRWHILAPPKDGDGYDLKGQPPDTADDLLRYSSRLSLSIRKQAWSRDHLFSFWKPGTRTLDIEAVPTVVIIDEGVALDAASGNSGGKSKKDKWFLEYLFDLRHDHIAMLYSIQEASSRSWRILESATAIHVFHIEHEWALGSLRAANPRNPDIARIPDLAPYEHVTLRSAEIRLKAPSAELAPPEKPEQPK